MQSQFVKNQTTIQIINIKQNNNETKNFTFNINKTALLSVGAWAENLRNGSNTLAYYGFQLTEAKSMFAGDVLGRRVDQPSKGLYIHNGKKVVIKWADFKEINN